MLDAELKTQLKSLFADLSGNVELVFDDTPHQSQGELLSMLNDVASASPSIRVRSSSQKSATPYFRIYREGRPMGAAFRGIPGGHEFSSLVLAILNSDGKGKMPEAAISSRIKGLKGPISIKTYVSLSCDNCPDVVQALNQMATLHDDFVHEMADGAFVQDEINALGIQGVPAVVANGRLIHSGRIQYLDLLKKLEDHFGSRKVQSAAENLGHFDVVVVGGGPAGVSAAIYSSRKGMKTALIAEKIGGQVQDTKGIENLIGITYTEGPQLAAQLYRHVAAYPVKVFEQRRVKRVTQENTRKIELESGDSLTADTLIVATGAKWRELSVPGEKEYLGRGVAYCPHCDGPFYKGKKVAVVGGGNSGVEAAIDLAGIVREVVLFEFNDALKADKVLVEKLQSLPNVSIVTSAKTTEIIGDGSKVTAIAYEDRKSGEPAKLDLDGVFIQIGLLPNSAFLKGIVELTKFGEIAVDEKGRTSAPGIYAAGDVADIPFKQIVIAMGDGAKAALAAFEDRMYAADATARKSAG